MSISRQARRLTAYVLAFATFASAAPALAQTADPNRGARARNGATRPAAPGRPAYEYEPTRPPASNAVRPDSQGREPGWWVTERSM